MTTPPTKEQLISLVESMCDVQERMLGARGLESVTLFSSKQKIFLLWFSFLLD